MIIIIILVLLTMTIRYINIISIINNRSFIIRFVIYYSIALLDSSVIIHQVLYYSFINKLLVVIVLI